MLDVLRHRVGARAGHGGARQGSADDRGDLPADRGDLVRIFDPPYHSLDQDSPQVEVLLAVLDQARDPRVAVKVERLLRPAVGPERDLPAGHHVVHGHQVREPVLAVGRQLNLAPSRQEVGCLLRRHRDPVALLHEPPPKPIVSLASDNVSSQAKPADRPAPLKDGPTASATESSVHISPSRARKTSRTLGGSITAATPPCTTNTSPLIAAPPGPAR